MKLLARRLLTTVGTGAALIGATAAVRGATPPAQAPTQVPALSAMLNTQEQAHAKLSAAMRDVTAHDQQAKGQVGALEASIAATRRKLAAARAYAAQKRLATPAVQATTGASGGGDDGGSGDDAGGDD